MQNLFDNHPELFPEVTAKFPSTRYQGSKTKIIDWIWDQISDLEFDTCLDAFGGTGVVAYRLKQEDKIVTYNDLLTCNYYNGKALIENNTIHLTTDDIDWILKKHKNTKYPSFIKDTFEDIYFTDEENAWIDRVITNIYKLSNPYKFALAFFALSQSCTIKRPYNLFHRKNLYMRLADIDRSFGNKTSWDRPFEEWFRIFAEEANQAVFDNRRKNKALCCDASEIPGEYDLVYIDTPYISGKGIGVDYRHFYHFLEGLTNYDNWIHHIDFRSRHRRLMPNINDWTNKNKIHGAFDRLFNKYRNSILVISYRSDGIPSENELVAHVKRHKKDVRIEHYGQYKYVLSKNNKSKELLIIGA